MLGVIRDCIGPETHATLSTNQLQNENQSRLVYQRFPALLILLVFTLSSDWLFSKIFLSSDWPLEKFLGFRHSVEKRSLVFKLLFDFFLSYRMLGLWRIVEECYRITSEES